jgi:hypothetical protein
MKKHLIIIAGIALFTGLLPPLAQQARAQVSVSFQVFYDQLSPFGYWVNYPDYGYVWVPGAGSGFRPYGTRGHWVYTDEGWTWVSDYSWGWATFHYGNWFYDDSYGWMWSPGYEWAPAWVTWGEYGGNYCWAPIGPRIDIGVSYSTYRPPARYWNFCPREHITSVNVSNYYVRNVHTTTVINNITVINNVNRGTGHAYIRGPQSANVERFTHSTIRPVAIRPASRPGTAAVHNGQLAIYRPSVQNNNAAARPTQVRDLHALRPVNDHPNTNTAVTRPGQQPSGQEHASSQPVHQHSQPNPVQHQATPVQPHTNPGQPHNSSVQPHSNPSQPHSNPSQPQNNPGQPHSNPVQPRPVQRQPAQPRPMQTHPAPVQPRPMQQQRPVQQQHPVQQQRPMPQQPRPQPVQHPAPRPVAPPHQNPPHQNPPPPHNPDEHHQ